MPDVKTSNPTPLGAFSFASTTLLHSLYNIHVGNVTQPNVIVGMALFTGGLAQLLAGMWAFPFGDVFSATAFTLYGAFWLSFATILLPGTGILDAYQDHSGMLDNALGIYLMTWFVITLLLLIVTLRKNIAFIVLFCMVDITFLILAISKFATSEVGGKVGGIAGLLTAVIAYYVALAELLAVEKNPLFTLPLGHLV